MVKEVNLLPRDIVDAEESKSRLRFWIIVASVTMLLSLPLFLNLERNIYKAKNEIHRNTKEKEKVKEMVSKLNLLKEEKEKLSLKQAILSEIIDDIPWHQTFFKISNSLNSNTWLEQMDISIGENAEKNKGTQPSDEVIKATGGYFASSKEGNKSNAQNKEKHFKISLYGYAISNIDLAEFMASLAAEDKFKSVNLEYAERTKLEGFEAVKFLIRCEI